MSWSTECKDWESRIIAGQSLVPCPPLFPEYAERALQIFKQLRMHDVYGYPTMGEACREWVFDIVRAVFGGYNQEDGRQYITEYFIHVSKKNGKSSLAAGIMLTALILNWRPAAELLVLAPTIKVAGNSFDPARGMVKLDDELDAMFHPQDHLKKITHRISDSVLSVIAADSDTVSGNKASIVLVDELWLFGSKSNAENMLREARGGQTSRPEGFTIYLTTQSDKPPAGIFLKKLQYARDVRDGKIHDPSFMPIIYEFPEHILKEELYKDPKYFYVTNPNLGLSVDIPYIEREYRTALNDGKESMTGFLAKHLNIEIGLSLGLDNWAGSEFWEKMSRSVTLQEIFDKSDVIEVGADGGGLDDLLGLAVLGRDSKDNTLWRAWFHAWCNPIALERRKSEAPKYLDFQEDGDLSIVPIGQDVDEFCEIVKQCDESGLLDRIGVDPSGIGAIVDKLRLMEIELEKDKGTDKARIFGVSQGWRLNGAIKDTERKLAEEALYHDGSRMMKWIVGNAKTEVKGSNTYITKQASGVGKIDPLMALLNAASLMILNPEARGGRSVYEGRGLLTF